MMSSGINLVMTVIGFVVSTLFIVFVCTRLVFARIQLSTSRRSFPMRSDLSMLERGLHGLEPVVVANFPTKKYRDECLKEANNSQCTVCLADYHEEDTLRILPFCGHSFHVTCIDIWLYQHSTCPICRVSMRENADKKRLMQPMFSSAIRSHYGTEMMDSHSYHCFRGHGYSTSMQHVRAMSSIQEGHFTSEENSAETGEPTTPADEVELIKNTNSIPADSPSNR
uniref:RING-type domain-containing protein n=1 Tax=Kalanchoe fedtschenkoi TaxID=63787 RepID=A0A7N0TQZ4_KALFE